MTTLACILSGLSLLMSVLLLINLNHPLGWIVIWPKLAAGALSPLWAVIGIAGAIVGWIYQALWVIPMGIVGAGIMIWYVWQCARDHNGFIQAFGAGWSDQILPQQTKKMVQRRWTLYLKLKTSPEISFERDIAFWTVPDTQRELLCDIWQPADSNISGLAFIFFHGSAWAILDKDFGTRPFFCHIASQGHTVMDVSYRLIPETNIYGMIGDVKRAIAWMKTNASRYGVDPGKIVLGGASAGAHLALLAGYAPHHPELIPEDVKNADLSVCGVVSYYGPTDLLQGYDYYRVKKQSEKLPPVPIGQKLSSKERFKYSGRLDILLGGHLQDIPEIYQLACPATHIHTGTPPTLLIQGNHDLLVPVNTTRAFYKKLLEAGVPAINVIYPLTEHIFDLVLPQLSPPAQSALYDVDRFLALLLNKN